MGGREGWGGGRAGWVSECVGTCEVVSDMVVPGGGLLTCLSLLISSTFTFFDGSLLFSSLLLSSSIPLPRKLFKIIERLLRTFNGR